MSTQMDIGTGSSHSTPFPSAVASPRACAGTDLSPATENFAVAMHPNNVAVVTLDIKGSPVNVIGATLTAELPPIVAKLEADPEVKAIVFISGKKARTLSHGWFFFRPPHPSRKPCNERRLPTLRGRDTSVGCSSRPECPDKDNDPLTRPANFLAQLQEARRAWNSQRGEGRPGNHSTRRQKKSRNTIDNPNTPPDYEPGHSACVRWFLTVWGGGVQSGFIAGADIAAFGPLRAEGKSAVKGMVTALQAFFTQMEAGKPKIAAISGSALGLLLTRAPPPPEPSARMLLRSSGFRTTEQQQALEQLWGFRVLGLRKSGDPHLTGTSNASC